MLDKRNAFLSHIVKRRLELELQRWTTALNHRFDVAILCPTAELQELVMSFLERITPLPGRIQRVRPHHSLVDDSVEHELSKTHPPAESGPLLPTIYVCRGTNLRGCGAIAFELPGLESLLPSAANMVITLLESAGLERFIDAFDGRKMSQLKKILDSNGVEDFFDAVVQVAYFVGFRGDEQRADAYLEGIQSKQWDAPCELSLGLKPQLSLDKLFEQLVDLPDPHDTLKAALAHYVFNRRRVSQAEASRILKVSRSTLQSHLQLAEHLNVARYFGPARALA
jgi:hypothetical protein